MGSINKNKPSVSDMKAWGKYATWLADKSLISFRKKGDLEWTDAIVIDDRCYYPNICKSVNNQFTYLLAV